MARQDRLKAHGENQQISKTLNRIHTIGDEGSANHNLSGAGIISMHFIELSYGYTPSTLIQTSNPYIYYLKRLKHDIHIMHLLILAAISYVQAA